MNRPVSRRVSFEGGAGYRLAGIVDSSEHVPVGTASPVVVFSHCFTCNKDLKAIVRISRFLAVAGVTVLRFDMTGLGGSEGEFSGTHFSSNVADLRAAIRFAGETIGPVVGLMGHSFGGAASFAVAGGSNRPDGIKCCVGLAAPSDTQHLADLLESMDPAIANEGLGTVSIGGRNWTIPAAMTADFRSHQLPDTIAKIDIPILLLHSPVDRTVPFDQAIRIETLIRSGGGEVSLVTLNGADHLLSNQTDDLPYVADLIAAFVRRCAA